jgi:hypothetical protein
MDNVLESYLVKLGASVDTLSFRKFNDVLSVSNRSATSFVTSLATSFVKLDATITSVFAGIGLSIISLADKTAMADQQYRLFGMRMLMSTESARAMQLATDELGASLDQIAYDPELNKRFQFLYEQNLKLANSLGSGFERNMRSIRDIRMEVKRFTTELEFMTMGTVNELFQKLGFGSGDLLNTFNKLNDWFTTNLPDIVDEVSSGLVPVWKSFELIMKDVKDVTKQFAGDFLFFTGLLLNDKSLSTTEFSLKNLISATKDWLQLLTETVFTLNLIGKIGDHTFKIFADMIGGNKAQASGDLKTRDALTQDILNQFHDIVSDAKGYFGSAKDAQKNPDLKNFSDYALSLQKTTNSVNSSVNNSDLAGLIQAAGLKYGIDPNFLSAVIHQESGYNPGLISSKGAKGLMQLMDPTASQYGATNSFDPSQSIDAGAHYLADLKSRYGGDVSKTLAAYNAGPTAVDKYGGIPPYSETKDYVSSILSYYSSISAKSQASGGGVVIENLNIQVPHALPEEQWTPFVKNILHETMNSKIRSTTAQTAGGPFN